MVGEPRKIVLTSLIVGALAIAAYISQSDKNWLSSDELGLEHDNGSAHHTRRDTMTGSVSTGPVAGRSGSAAAVAGDLQAARNSPRGNDFAAAQAQRDAVRAVRQDDDQVLALQGDVVARTEPTPALAQGEMPAQKGGKSARSSLPSSGKADRTRESSLATHEHSNRASGYAKNRRGSETAVAPVSAASTSSGRTRATGTPVVASSSPVVRTEVKVVSNPSSGSAASRPSQAEQQVRPSQPGQPAPALSPDPLAEQTAQAAPAPVPPSSPLPSQLSSSGGTQLKSEAGPKTRAQVRAEIARARADGSLPAFGNPDPGGPGGAPSLTTTPRP
jgi:hypothetical protein